MSDNYNEKEIELCECANDEHCDCHELHKDNIDNARINAPDEQSMREVADLYKLFSDYSRVKLMYLLAGRELCVCDITELMEINQSAVSNQLRLLRNSKLIKCRREGKNIYYSLADDHVESILRQGLEHVNE